VVFLYILLGIILLFALIFSLFIKAEIIYRNESGFGLKAGAGPVMITVTPKKKKEINLKDYSYKKFQKRLEKEKKKKEKAALKKAKKEKAKKEAEKLAPDSKEKDTGKMASIISLIKFGIGEVGILISSIKTEIRSLHIICSGEDAADTAIKYGTFSAGISTILELLSLSSLKPPRDGCVTLDYDFLSDKSKFDIDIIFKIRIFTIIRIGMHALVWFIKSKIKNKT